MISPRLHGRQGRQRGLSLIEVALAVAILTVLALCTAVTAVPISRQARIGREVGIADGEVRDVLEKVHGLSFGGVTSLYPPGSEIPITALPDGKIVVSYVDPAADPLVMRLDLSWESANVGTMTRHFVTVMTR